MDPNPLIDHSDIPPTHTKRPFDAPGLFSTPTRFNTHTTPARLDPHPPLTYDPATPLRQFRIRTALHATGLYWFHADITAAIGLNPTRAHYVFHDLTDESRHNTSQLPTTDPSAYHTPHGRRQVNMLTGIGLDTLLSRYTPSHYRTNFTAWAYETPIHNLLRELKTGAPPPPPADNPAATGYHTPAQLAAALHVSHNTPYRWCQRVPPYIRYTRTTGGAYRIPNATAEALLSLAPTHHTAETAPRHYAALFRALEHDPTATRPYF